MSLTTARLLVVSHPCVVSANQSLYVKLLEHGWDITMVVPARWQHDYSSEPFEPEALLEMTDRMVKLPVLNAGLPQRHAYRARLAPVIRKARPDVAFLEQEPFALPSLQWGRALVRARVPFGLQSDENLDRKLSLPARWIQRMTLPNASFVSARSPRAAELIWKRASRLDVQVVPHAVPEWPVAPRQSDRPFTVGFAGRLVPEKGIDDLLAATRDLPAPWRLRFYGDGPLRKRIEAEAVDGGDIQVVSGMPHERMAEAFGEMDVLVLPSRTTQTWAEQFGRVLVEALWCGTPVVGSDSGEIPWVISTTGGGLVFPEGDRVALTDRLLTLRNGPDLRRRLATQGRHFVEDQFSVSAAAKLLDAQLRRAIGLDPCLAPGKG